MASLKDRLTVILLRDDLVSQKDLDKAIAEQKKAGGELSKILVKLELIDASELAQVLSECLGLPLMNISRIRIEPAVIEILPKEVAIKYKVIPISLLGDQLTLAMADPLNIFVVDNIKSLIGMAISPIIGRADDIEKAIGKYYENEVEEVSDETEGSDAKFDEIMRDIKGTGDLELLKDQTVQQSTVEEISDEAPIIKLVDTIIQQAVLAKASDVFIEPMDKEMRIRYRIDGVIREIDRMSKALNFPIVGRIKVISNLDISEHRLPQDGRFRTIIAGNHSVDFRVSVLPTVSGEKVVLRVLDQEGATALNVDNIGFQPESLAQLKEAAMKPHGLILTCGPTGSGKTTTLYSVLNSVNSPKKNIVTVEDPVEYQLKGINQVNIKPAMGLTFATSLRSILRQDPDIILIGEIRDSETLDIAVKAALTGHLVLSSLHTTTAAGSVSRMMNMGIEPFLICSSVLAIVAQRLLRKLCDGCKEEYEVPTDLIKKVELDPDRKYKMYRGVGCSKCFKTGYQGRVGISEVLGLSAPIKEIILAESGEVKLKREAIKMGMITMRQDALRKAEEGLTSLEEVIRITASDKS